MFLSCLYFLTLAATQGTVLIIDFASHLSHLGGAAERGRRTANFALYSNGN